MCDVGVTAGCRPSPIADGVPRFGETRLTLAAVKVGSGPLAGASLSERLRAPGRRRHGGATGKAAHWRRSTSDWPMTDQRLAKD